MYKYVLFDIKNKNYFLKPLTNTKELTNGWLWFWG